VRAVIAIAQSSTAQIAAKRICIFGVPCEPPTEPKCKEFS
jgi:hypothetical protein